MIEIIGIEILPYSFALCSAQARSFAMPNALILFMRNSYIQLSTPSNYTSPVAVSTKPYTRPCIHITCVEPFVHICDVVKFLFFKVFTVIQIN